MNKNLFLIGGTLTIFAALEIIRIVKKDNVSVEFTKTVAKHIREENKALKERFDQDIKDLRDEIDKLKKSSK